MRLTKADVAEIFLTYATVYPEQSRQIEDEKALIQVYYDLLKEYPAEVVRTAATNAMKTCKFLPKPSEIIDEVRKITTSFELSEGELFAQLKSAAGKSEDLFGQFNYTFVRDGKTQGERAREEVRELYESLDPVLKEYIGGVSGLLSLARNDEEQWGYERARFARSLETNRRRVQIKTKMPEMGKLLTGNALKQLN